MPWGSEGGRSCIRTSRRVRSEAGYESKDIEQLLAGNTRAGAKTKAYPAHTLTMFFNVYSRGARTAKDHLDHAAA